mgnify:CR=1 FL=1
MHIMIDLETMGTRPDAPIISIGAVAFDANGPLDSFYAGVNLGSSVNSGAKIDASTVLWWMQQSDEARAALVPKDDELRQCYLEGVLLPHDGPLPLALLEGPVLPHD